MAVFGVTEVNDTTQILQTEVLSEKQPVFNVDTTLDKIVKQIGGYKWYVNYFNLINDMNSYQSDIDVDVTSSLVEYNRIKNLIIFLDNPIETAKPTDIEGSGYITAKIVPKNGDVFTAKLIDGRIGIFKLTSVERNNYNLEYIYHIGFKLDMIIKDNDDDYYQTLLSRVVTTYIYNKDSLLKEEPDLITEEQYEHKINIDKILHNLVEKFNNTIINTSTKYRICYVDENGNLIYDPYLENFVRRTIGVDLHSRVNLIGYDLEESSVLNVILNDVDKNLINKYYTEIPSNDYGVNPYFRQIYWSGISYVIKLNNNTEEYYLYTKDFYDVLYGIKTIEDVTLEPIELLVLSLINNEPINIDLLMEVYNSLYMSNDQFTIYYDIPVLIYGFKTYIAQNGIYTNLNTYIKG